MNNIKARVIAFYLPQFHTIPENDEWWGEGFTEWTNVKKATPLFNGHNQPRIPADLGYYNLLDPEVREAQVNLAKKAGVEGFMYWHYWFGNDRRLLEKPFDEVLVSGKPDFPFCLGWANHSWFAKNWNSRDSKNDKLLIEQVYPGLDDFTKHFYYVLNAFRDSRYITVDGSPVFFIYEPNLIPDVKFFLETWRNLAKLNGLKNIYFIGQARMNSDCEKILNLGFDGVCRAGIEDVYNKIRGTKIKKLLWYFKYKFKFKRLNSFRYVDVVNNLLVQELDSIENIYPTVIPNFDHTPRSGIKGLIYIDSTPELFRKLLKSAIEIVRIKKVEHRIIFLRSWNEWAEGNYVEPDTIHKHDFLNVMKDEIIEV